MIPGLGLAHPWLLLLLPLALAPLAVRSSDRIAHPGTSVRDRLSSLIEIGLRGAASLAIAALVVGLAGPFRDGHTVLQTTTGAQVVIVLDRSRSMEDSFAGGAAGAGETSKAKAASALLLDFVAARPDNIYGVVEFSTSPIFALPLTPHTDAVRAALRAAADDGLALTAVSGALGMAANMFDGQPRGGSRVVLLVSDGAAAIPPQADAAIRAWFNRNGLRLIWIYMRTAGHPGLAAAAGVAGSSGQRSPEQVLHEYFQSLGVPYRAYQADNPAAMRQAITDLNHLEGDPVRLPVTVARQPLDQVCYLAALGLIGVLLGARATAVRSWA